MQYKIKSGPYNKEFYEPKSWEVLKPWFEITTNSYPAGQWFIAQVPEHIRNPDADTNSTKLIAVHETGNCFEIQNLDKYKREVAEFLEYNKEEFLIFTK